MTLYCIHFWIRKLVFFISEWKILKCCNFLWNEYSEKSNIATSPENCLFPYAFQLWIKRSSLYISVFVQVAFLNKYINVHGISWFWFDFVGMFFFFQNKLHCISRWWTSLLYFGECWPTVILSFKRVKLHFWVTELGTSLSARCRNKSNFYWHFICVPVTHHLVWIPEYLRVPHFQSLWHTSKLYNWWDI